MTAFQGLSFLIDLDGIGTDPGGMLWLLMEKIVDEGGRLTGLIKLATHVVLRHKQQKAYQHAQQQLPGRQHVVTAQWVLLSASRQHLMLPCEDDLYTAAAIPGFAERVRHVTLSGINGVDRALTRYKVECTGARFSPEMRLPATSHLITTAAACEQPSEKFAAAAKHHLHVLPIDWVDACLSAWAHLPEAPFELI